MAGREIREYTNLSDPKDKKIGSKGARDKTDDEDLEFKRMVAKMQEVAGERGGYLHGRGALDSDDLLYLKEQMEAEEDAERLRRRTEKRAFAAFKKAASLADASPAPVLPPIRVEPKPRSGIRQHVLLKSIVEVKPKRHRISVPADGAAQGIDVRPSPSNLSVQTRVTSSASNTPEGSHEHFRADARIGGGLLGLAYETSDDEESDSEPNQSPEKRSSIKSVIVVPKSSRSGTSSGDNSP